MEEYWRWFMYQTKILPEQRVNVWNILKRRKICL